MSGEINLERNGLFADDETVVLTRSRLNQLISGLVARIAAGSITSREIADGSISVEKLTGALISTAFLMDLAVTTAKLSDGAVTRDKLGLVALPQISEVYTTGAQTLTAGEAPVDVTDLSITITPRSANSRFLVSTKMAAYSESGGKLYGWFMLNDNVNAALGRSYREVGALKNETLTFFHLISPASADSVKISVRAESATNDIALVTTESSLLVQEII